MGKKLRNFLVAFVAALGLVVLAFASQTTTTKAATYSTNDLLSGMSIQQKNYGTASDVNLTLDWDATGKELHDGDTWTIQLPDTLKVKSPGETIPITDKDGNTIGNAVLNADNTITVTFNEKVEDKQDFSGSINITSGIGVGKGASVGDNNVVIGDKNDNMTVTTSDSDFSKKGTIGTDENGDAIITWTILVNRNSQNFNNLKVSDYIDPEKTGQTYIKDSVKVYEASWTSPGYYKKDTLLDEGSYDFSQSENGFELTLPKSDQFYAITLQTKINDPDNMVGTKFKNHADFTWDGGSGNGSNKGSADGSVTSNANSGNGDGNDILGSVVLTKMDADNDSTLLNGAVYDLYKVGSDTPIKTGLTTGKDGKITVSGLSKGNYYFKEVSAPDGYQTNGNEVPFNITGKTSAAVNVTAKDELTGSKDGSIVVMKLDAETGYRLSGASFEIIDKKDNNVVGSFTTDQLGIGHYYNLPIGDYILRETAVPSDKYLLSEDIEFSITEDNLTPALISVDDEVAGGIDDSYSVDLQKFDREDMKTVVPGAEYTLYNADDNSVITSGITDSNGVLTIQGLKPGNYYFLESRAPTGYELNPEKIPFTITDNGDGVGVGTLETSDPRTEGSGGGGNTTDPDVDENDGNEEDNNNGGNEGNPDVDGNGDNNGNEDNNNGGGVIVDPSNPGSNNNGDNNNNGGIITNPGSSNSTNTNDTLPQTGSKSGLLVSLMGLVVLLGTVYFKRRHA